MMGRKPESFTQEDQRLALVAKAVSHPARIAILRILAKRGTCKMKQVSESCC